MAVVCKHDPLTVVMTAAFDDNAVTVAKGNIGAVQTADAGGFAKCMPIPADAAVTAVEVAIIKTMMIARATEAEIYPEIIGGSSSGNGNDRANTNECHDCGFCKDRSHEIVSRFSF
jgi:hypothetical protein